MVKLILHVDRVKSSPWALREHLHFVFNIFADLPTFRGSETSSLAGLLLDPAFGFLGDVKGCDLGGE